MTTTTAVDVVIVAADSGPVLLDCVAAVLSCTAVQRLRLLDNASRDGYPRQVQEQYADDRRVQLTHHDRNLGFGAAVNRGAEGLDAEWLLVLNPDVVLQPDDLSRLLSLAASRPDAGLLGASMVDDTGRVDRASRRRDPTLRRVLAQLHLLPGETIDEAPQQAQPLQEVENVSGALLLLRRAAFERLGGFDEGYFLHFEDLDLCRRMRDAGFRVLLAADVEVLHRQGSSSHHRPFLVAWHKHRGMWRWFSQHDSLVRSWWGRVFAALAIGAHFALQIPRLLWRKLMP